MWAAVSKRGREDLAHVRGQGQRPRVPGCNGAGTAERSYPASEVSGGGWEELPASEVRGRSREELAAGRRHPESEVRGGSWEEPPTPEARPGGATRGSVAAQAQEGLEELSHNEGQEQRR